MLLANTSLTLTLSYDVYYTSHISTVVLCPGEEHYTEDGVDIHTITVRED